MNHHKFTYLFEKVAASRYFVIKDTIDLEYSSNGLYAESMIKWRSCHEFVLIIEKINDASAVLQPGDTLSVKVTSVHNDTLMCDVSSHNRTFSFEYLRSNY